MERIIKRSMTMNETIKNILIGIAVVAVLFLAYKVLVGREKEVVEPAVVATPAPASAPVSSVRSGSAADILLRVENIKVDTQIFSSSIFKSLRDFRVEIPPEPVGKANPFSS